MRTQDRVKTLLGALASRTPAFRGKTRLVRRLDRLLGAGPVPEVERAGVRWRLDTSEIIQFGIFYHGGYGRAVIEALARHATLGHRPLVLWDVGANLGAVSLPLLARLPSLRVEAFEPSPTVLDRLRRQVALNPRLAERLRIHPSALSDTDGLGTFFESNSRTNQGIGSLVQMHNTEATGRPVATVSGDGLIARGEAEIPDLLKIDVEGWELHVLHGLAGTLRAHRPLVVMEYEGYRHAGAGRSLADFQAFFTDCGYSRLGALDARGGFEPLGARSRESADLIALP
jgi:FkbM family methyltransferase